MFGKEKSTAAWYCNSGKKHNNHRPLRWDNYSRPTAISRRTHIMRLWTCGFLKTEYDFSQEYRINGGYTVHRAVVWQCNRMQQSCIFFRWLLIIMISTSCRSQAACSIRYYRLTSQISPTSFINESNFLIFSICNWKSVGIQAFPSSRDPHMSLLEGCVRLVCYLLRQLRISIWVKTASAGRLWSRTHVLKIASAHY